MVSSRVQGDGMTLSEQFRSVFRAQPASVALVTANANGVDVGITVSSVASLSIDPVALSFSVTKTSGSAAGILSAPSILVHMLGPEHTEVANAFAKSGAPRFTPEQGWVRLNTGEMHLPSAPYALRGRLLDTLTVGSSRLIATEILEIFKGPETGRLLYRDREYLTL